MKIIDGCYAHCGWFTTLLIAGVSLLAPGSIRGQQTGPSVDQCSSGIVDYNTGVEQTVCLYGDQSGLDGYVQVDDWGGGNSWYWADAVGASGYLDSSYLGDQCCSGSETVYGSIVPQVNTWYSLTGYFDEDVCDGSWNCYWQTGNYGLSVAVEVTSSNSPPSPPTGLTAGGGNGQVTLSWTAAGGATSYNIYEGTSSSGESSTPVATGISATSYTVSGLSNGTAYYFKVAALNSFGTSGYSNEAAATPAAPPSNACSSGIVDWQTGVEMTVCLYGSPSEVDAYVEVDNSGGGNSWYWADQVGAQGYMNGPGLSSWLNDNCCSGYETTYGSAVPQLNQWYYLTGYYDEDVCDEYWNCNWQYGMSGLTVAIEVTQPINPPPAPAVANVNPSSGYAGLPVNISGSNFGATKGASTVTFNGASAGVLSWNDSSITAVVPSNATTGPVVVTLANGQTSNNNVIFTVNVSSCY